MFRLETSGLDEEVANTVDGFNVHLERFIFAEIHERVARPDAQQVVGGAVRFQLQGLHRGAVDILCFGGIEIGGTGDDSDGFATTSFMAGKIAGKR